MKPRLQYPTHIVKYIFMCFLIKDIHICQFLQVESWRVFQAHPEKILPVLDCYDLTIAYCV